MIRKISAILEYSRVFSLPMSVFSWLIIFTYAIIDSGNKIYGIIALIGICFAHLGANLLDDYFDYKALIKQVNFNKEEYLKNSQKTKCRYLINNSLSLNSMLRIIIFHFATAGLCGLFLYFKCGIGVAYYTFAAAILIILYSFMSRICLSEIAIGLVYGPILFGGVYYVMCGDYSNTSYLLSIPSMFMTIILLYIHTIMDFNFDLAEGKKTIANRFNSPLDSLIILKVFLVLSYISITLLCIFDITDWQVFIAYLTIPLAKDLYHSLNDFVCNPNTVPQRKWFHFPMEKLNKLKEDGAKSFMFRMFQSRNLMMYFSISIVIGIILSLGI